MWSTLESVLYWTDNVEHRIHRFDPRTGRDEEIRLDEDVMDLVLVQVIVGGRRRA